MAKMVPYSFLIFFSFVDNPKGLDPIDVYANVEASLADVLLNSQACSSRAAVCNLKNGIMAISRQRGISGHRFRAAISV